MSSILPYIEASPIYFWIDFDQPWDSAENAGIFMEPYTTYQNPRVRMTVKSWDFYPAHYSANSHLLGPNSFVKTEEIPAKSSMMLVGELHSRFVPWGSPFNDLPLESTNPQEAYGTPARDGWIVLMADGSCQVLSGNIAPELLHALSGLNLAISDNAPKNIERPNRFTVPADALKRRFSDIEGQKWRLDFIDSNGRVVRSKEGKGK